MKNHSTVVGLDVHKESIAIALAPENSSKETRFFGEVGGDLGSFGKALRKLRSTGEKLRFVYETGPCGYEIYRYLKKEGLECSVVAPSLIPQKSGDRVKTDRRDAMNLARLHRAGELTSVYVPTEEDEAMRDLSRGREDAVKAQNRARLQLCAFLLRHGCRYEGLKRWNKSHFEWLSRVTMKSPAQQFVLQEYVNTIREAESRVERLTRQMEELTPAWGQYPKVRAYQAMRGISLISACAIASELGDLSRFDNPSQLMAFVGLVPSEHSSGGSTRRGGITKTGNGHVRRVLVEAAWAYRHPARIGPVLMKRQETLEKVVLEKAWKAQVRLCGKFKKMATKGKPFPVIVAAIARELIAFVWSISQVTKV